MVETRHHPSTVAAIAVLAFVVTTVAHEGVGHGLMALLSGSRHVVLSYTYLSSDLTSRSISAAGPLVNLVFGLGSWSLLRSIRMGPALAYFVLLLLDFNLLVVAAYLVYSGVLNSGDLAVVVAGQPPSDLIRISMVVAGVVLYWRFMLLGAVALARFRAPQMRLMTVPYIAALALNCCAALLNPLGMEYFLISALPATLAANAGLFALPSIAEDTPLAIDVLVVARSYVWIAAGMIAGFFYIFVIGPGIRLRS